MTAYPISIFIQSYVKFQILNPKIQKKGAKGSQKFFSFFSGPTTKAFTRILTKKFLHNIWAKIYKYIKKKVIFSLAWSGLYQRKLKLKRNKDYIRKKIITKN